MTNKVKIMNWKSYEDMVTYIYAHLGKLDGVEILCSGENCKETGKSGVDHQIDVLTSHSAGPHSYKTAIECKYWKDKVHKDVVTKLSEILEDAQIEKGVVVSKSGFTQDAVKFAKYKGINLVELREPTDDDWKGRIRNITVNIEAHIPNVCGYEFIPDVSSTIESRPDCCINSRNMYVKRRRSVLREHVGALFRDDRCCSWRGSICRLGESCARRTG